MDVADTGSGERSHDTVAGWIRQATQRFGDAVAIRDGKDQLTYTEIGQLIDGVAAYLAERGIGPGDRVGLCLERSIEAVVCPLAVLVAGAAYVPLDPLYPADRLTIMQREGDLSLLVVHDLANNHLPDDRPVVSWDSVRDSISVDATFHREVRTEDTAYVVFTSGSTGVPKGIELPNRALANLIGWQLSRASFHHRATVLQFSSLSFDVSFQEIATTYASGGCLVVTSDEQRRDPRQLLRVLADTRAERIFLPFVALRSLADATVSTTAPRLALREVITAGEQLRVDDTLREFFVRLDGATLDNQYGPSETHVITAHLLESDPSAWPTLPPIGVAVSGCSVFVLDDEMQPVEPGTVGQIHLGGEHLAHGYLGRSDLTDAAFLTYAHDGVSERVYASGDLGEFDEEGLLHYRGRGDGQLKIRGHRVEPAEIDNVAELLPDVSQSRTVARTKPSGNAFLTSYVVAAGGAELDIAHVREHLTTSLPPYMVPAFVVVVDALPRTPSGKVNLRGLPDPATEYSIGDVAYDSEVEEQLAAIWREVLGFPAIPRDVSFFDLGGDSLEAAELFVRITDRLGTDLPLATLVNSSTIGELADEIANRRRLSEDFRSLQLLGQGTSDTPPLFMVHGGAGNVLIFGELANNLGPNQTVYGLQWSGWDGGRGPHTVEEMATSYLDEIRRVQPHGPYRLGGHCLGGLVALEVARLLKDSGEELDGPIIVSDAPNLTARSYHRDEPESNPASKARYDAMCSALLDAVPATLRTGGWRGDIESSPSTTDDDAWQPSGLRAAARSVPGLRPAVRWARSSGKKALVSAVLASGRPIPRGWRLAYCQQTLRPAARRYVPRPYSGEILYLRTATSRAHNMALTGWWDDPFMGFDELCSGHFDARVVGGGHNEALTTPESAALVKRAFAG